MLRRGPLEPVQLPAESGFLAVGTYSYERTGRLMQSSQQNLIELSALAHHPANLCSNSEACTALWMAAIKDYAKDARAYANKGKAPDDGEAFADLLTSCRLLANLCEPLGLNLDAARRMIYEFVG